MAALFENNAFSLLTASIASGDLALTVTGGDGALFPAPTGSDYFYATLIDTSNNLEIIKCTARTTDTLTIVRAQEGTTARAYAIGDRIELRITKAGLAEKITADSADTLTNKTINSATIATPTINGVISGDSLATQAEQETGTAGDNIVSSGQQVNHPSAAKGWIKADFAAGVEASYNVTSISDVGVGRPIVNWATDFSSTEYSVIAITKTGSAYYTHIADGNFNAGQTEINIRNTSGTLVDGTSFMAQAFGDR